MEDSIWWKMFLRISKFSHKKMESRKSFFWKNIERSIYQLIYIYTRTYGSNQDKVSILNQDKEYWRQMETVRYRIIKKK